jgi:microcystin degradation protein MlrC
MGTRILVYSATTAEQSRDAAVEIAAAFYPSRFALRQSYPSITEALDRAAVTSGPVVMADFADNAHGGAPSDSSFFLEALVQRESGKVAIGAFWDPVLAEICADAGIGAKMNVRLGGKCGPSSGIPIDIDVEIMNIAQNHIQSALGDKQSMGLSVWLRHRDIDIVVCSVRTQVFSPSAFTGLGIDLAVAKLIVVKSMVHFRAAFQENFETIWTVGTPGALQPDLKTIDYINRRGAFFPMQDDPWLIAAPECWTSGGGWQPVQVAMNS